MVTRLTMAICGASVLLVMAGCSESATPLVQRLAAAPVPEGADLLAAAEADGDFERGPSASLEYSVTESLAEACPQVLALYADADYALFDRLETPGVITDPQLYCEQELEPTAGISVPAAIAIAYPMGEDSRFSVDGIVIVLTGGDDGGSLLRMSAG